MNTSECTRGVAMALCWIMGACGSLAQQQTIRVDLSSGSAREQWHLSDKATIADGELHVDGRDSVAGEFPPAFAFLKAPAFGDVSLSASYRVDADKGVLAVGFALGSTDSLHFTYVHYDKSSAILCHTDNSNDWNEIKRTGAVHVPGTWYRATFERKGTTLRVHFDGKLLFEAPAPNTAAGLVGFYANQTTAHLKDIVVTGMPASLEKPWAAVKRPRNWIHVCTDAGAGAYEAFPDVCRLADGRLMCVFYAGYGHVSLPNEALPKGGRVSYCLSSDEGRTWSAAHTLYDGPHDDRDPSIAQLADGRIVCNFFSLKSTPGEKRSWTGLGSWLVTSRDAGKTWDTEPRQIAAGYYCSAPVRPLPDGRLMLGLYKEEAGTACGAVSISTDQGESWGAPIDIPNGGVRLDAETDVLLLKNGDIFAALRGRSVSAWSVSKDGGNTWSVAKLFGFPGHCHYLLRAPGDIILMAHRLPSTSLHYSLDEGRTWSENVLVDTVGGAYPSMVELRDGTILIVYYEEGGGSSIRAKRFRATPQGIEWLTLDDAE